MENMHRHFGSDGKNSCVCLNWPDRKAEDKMDSSHLVDTIVAYLGGEQVLTRIGARNSFQMAAG
jgi:hypothetical protein